MITVEKVDTGNRAQVRQFVHFPFKLYKDCKNWVPPILSDVRVMLNKEKHPFYEHSEADFFLAYQGKDVVGRIGVLDNRPYNQHHQAKKANFYLFESVDDGEVASALFEQAYEWCQKRKMEVLVGPKGFSLFDGYGILIDGFEHRQMMTMMNYHLPYYAKLLSDLGLKKEVDFVSYHINPDEFHMPERVHEISRRIQERGTFRIMNFKSKKELVKLGPRIAKMYNDTFINNWEYAPITQKEIQFLIDNVLMVADHRLIKIIMCKEELAGFLFAFPDISASLQRYRGRLHPLAIADLLMEMKRTRWVAFNGGGVLPEYHGRGGNALLYAEMENTIHQYHYKHAECTQIADTAVQMRKDLGTLGGESYKTHRVYQYHL